MKRKYAFVGTWKDFGGHGEGIYSFMIDPETGDWVEADHFRGFRNNSILSVSHDKKTLYSTIEDKNYKDRWGAGGGLLSLSIEAETGKLTLLNEASALGACTSYICADPTGRYVIVTNHGSGLDIITKVIRDEEGGYQIVNEFDDSTLVMYELCQDGRIGKACDLRKHTGRGALDVRGQRCSHLHSVNFDPSGKWALVCDKGCDRIYVYRVNKEKGTLDVTPHTIFPSRPGTAPRHLEFHPFLPYCFVNHETASSVSAYSFDADAGLLRELDYQLIIEPDPEIKPEMIGDIYGSPADIHVHPNGKFLYVSQRSSYHTGKGVDCIAVFSIDPENAHLTRRYHTILDGPCPRGFAIDPDGCFLYVANQYMDTISRYRIDEKTGALMDQLIVAHADTPTCIRIVEMDC